MTKNEIYNGSRHRDKHRHVTGLCDRHLAWLERRNVFLCLCRRTHAPTTRNSDICNASGFLPDKCRPHPVCRPTLNAPPRHHSFTWLRPRQLRWRRGWVEKVRFGGRGGEGEGWRGQEGKGKGGWERLVEKYEMVQWLTHKRSNRHTNTRKHTEKETNRKPYPLPLPGKRKPQTSQ